MIERAVFGSRAPSLCQADHLSAGFMRWSSLSPGAGLFPVPSRNAATSPNPGVLRFIVEVLTVVAVRAMELITILNRCHRFRGFVYHRARFTSDHRSIEISVRPRKRSAAVCSRCHQPAPGYDQLPERRFEFIPLWGFFVFLLYAMRRVDCRPCGAVVVEEVPWGDGKRTLTRAHMCYSWPAGAPLVLERNRRSFS